MCAEDNMQVAYCSTPSNYFHILRRQLKRDFRKPLILMTRNPAAPQALVSASPPSRRARPSTGCCRTTRSAAPMRQAGEGRQDPARGDLHGKVYYDLLEEREKRGIDDVCLLRVEQLYPFPAKSVASELARFKKADVVWCQEEPKNMGSWTFVEPYLEWVLKTAGSKVDRPRYVGRPASAATATGIMSKHMAQLQAFLDEVFAG
jgi:2-oxoglutarate dehydrogenase E1 component